MNRQADIFEPIIEWFAKDYPDFFKMLLTVGFTAVAAIGIYKFLMRMSGLETRMNGLETRMTVVETRLDKITEVLNEQTATLQSILMYLVSKKEQKKILRQKLKEK